MGAPPTQPARVLKSLRLLFVWDLAERPTFVSPPCLFKGDLSWSFVQAPSSPSSHMASLRSSAPPTMPSISPSLVGNSPALPEAGACPLHPQASGLCVQGGVAHAGRAGPDIPGRRGKPAPAGGFEESLGLGIKGAETSGATLSLSSGREQRHMPTEAAGAGQPGRRDLMCPRAGTRARRRLRSSSELPPSLGDQPGACSQGPGTVSTQRNSPTDRGTAE